MLLPIDWSLLAVDTTMNNALSYVENITPKLHILQEIANDNARESAKVASDKANMSTQTPSDVDELEPEFVRQWKN